jgi:hypothetical protein
MEASSQLHPRPLSPRGKETSLRSRQEVVSPEVGLDAVAKRKILVPAGSWTRSSFAIMIDSPASEIIIIINLFIYSSFAPHGAYGFDSASPSEAPVSVSWIR